MQQPQEGLIILGLFIGTLPLGYLLTRFDKAIEAKLGKVGYNLLYLAVLIGTGALATYLVSMGFLMTLFGLSLGARLDANLKAHKAARQREAEHKARLTALVDSIEAGIAALTIGGAPCSFDVTAINKSARDGLIKGYVERGLTTVSEVDHNNQTVTIRLSRKSA